MEGKTLLLIGLVLGCVVFYIYKAHRYSKNYNVGFGTALWKMLNKKKDWRGRTNYDDK
ncbi:MAG: hypothetical protein JW838_03840 [Spirochaetes bacterium]|nr:hypothetical protein [Spirochaetota bacterium]